MIKLSNKLPSKTNTYLYANKLVLNRFLYKREEPWKRFKRVLTLLLVGCMKWIVNKQTQMEIKPRNVLRNPNRSNIYRLHVVRLQSYVNTRWKWNS
jgi:hypothetical protein